MIGTILRSQGCRWLGLLQVQICTPTCLGMVCLPNVNHSAIRRNRMPFIVICVSILRMYSSEDAVCGRWCASQSFASKYVCIGAVVYILLCNGCICLI